MKTLFKVFATSALIVLFSTASITIYAGNSNTPTAVDQSQQVSSLLSSEGYTVLAVTPANDGSGNYIAHVVGGKVVVSPGLSIVAIQNLPN